MNIEYRMSKEGNLSILIPEFCTQVTLNEVGGQIIAVDLQR